LNKARAKRARASITVTLADVGVAPPNGGAVALGLHTSEAK